MKPTLTLLFLILCLSGWAQKKPNINSLKRWHRNIDLVDTPTIWTTKSGKTFRFDTIINRRDTLRWWVKIAQIDVVEYETVQERWMKVWAVCNYLENGMVGDISFHKMPMPEYYLLDDRKTKVTAHIIDNFQP